MHDRSELQASRTGCPRTHGGDCGRRLREEVPAGAKGFQGRRDRIPPVQDNDGPCLCRPHFLPGSRRATITCCPERGLTACTIRRPGCLPRRARHLSFRSRPPFRFWCPGIRHVCIPDDPDAFAALGCRSPPVASWNYPGAPARTICGCPDIMGQPADNTATKSNTPVQSWSVRQSRWLVSPTRIRSIVAHGVKNDLS